MGATGTNSKNAKISACSDLIEEMKARIIVANAERVCALARRDMTKDPDEAAGWQGAADEAAFAMASYEEILRIAEEELFA